MKESIDEYGEAGDSDEEYRIRLPEKLRYKYQDDGGYTDLTVTKIGDEYCIENSGSISFYRKNDSGTYPFR